MNEASVKRDWLRILSLAVIVAGFSVIIVIGSLLMIESSGGWSFLGVIVFGPVCLALVFVDVLIKMFIKDKNWLIWLLELVAIGLIYVFWMYKIR